MVASSIIHYLAWRLPQRVSGSIAGAETIRSTESAAKMRTVASVPRCRETCIMPDDPTGNLESDCEYRTMTGGEWFKIDKAGRIVAKLPPQ